MSRLKNLSMIYASTEDGAIGYQNELPWHLVPEDMTHFLNYTKGKTLIMGRKTWEGLNFKGFPGRAVICLTTDESNVPKGSGTSKIKGHTVYYPYSVMTSFNELLEYIEQRSFEEFVVCGGKEIYQLFENYVSEISHSTIPATELKDDIVPDTYYRFAEEAVNGGLVEEKYKVEMYLKIGRTKPSLTVATLKFKRDK